MRDVFLARMRRDIVSETLADETIIIDMADGRYFRVRGLASSLWEALVEPVALDDVFAMAPTDQKGAVARYFLGLEHAGLVVADAKARACLAETSEADRADMEPGLALEIYDDMADLLLLDPVHDVDSSGWPARPPVDG